MVASLAAGTGLRIVHGMARSSPARAQGSTRDVSFSRPGIELVLVG
jgi:hypothetical protein